MRHRDNSVNISSSVSGNISGSVSGRKSGFEQTDSTTSSSEEFGKYDKEYCPNYRSRRHEEDRSEVPRQEDVMCFPRNIIDINKYLKDWFARLFLFEF